MGEKIESQGSVGDKAEVVFVHPIVTVDEFTVSQSCTQ
jgi:hypothetical protein